jgi:hypothetical protein
MFIDTRLGNTPRWFMDRPEDWAMRVPEIVRKNVVFLARVIQNGSIESLHFAGTGFFVNVPASAPDQWHVYLVTAKHVVEQLALGDWLMRVNVEGGTFRDIRGTKDHKWWFHPTECDKTDVAITQVVLPEKVDITAVAEDMFLDDQDISPTGIGAGDEVFVVGLFNRMRGQSRNLPLVRIGNIAMIPDSGELVPGVKIGINRVVDAEAYLIEARSIGGISGSPVFVRTTVEWPDTMSVRGGPIEKTSFFLPGPFYLLGLVNGHWDIDPMEKNDPDPRSGKKPEAVNLGIAVVIPVKKIRDTLHHPELVAARRQSDQQLRDARTTTLD